MARNGKTLNDRLSGRGHTGRPLRIPVDALSLLAGEPGAPITFSDLAAVLGMDLYEAGKAVRALRHAGLIERVTVTGGFNRSRYELTELAERLLSPRVSAAGSQVSEDPIDAALLAAADHNRKARISRVAAVGSTVRLCSTSPSAGPASSKVRALTVNVTVRAAPELKDEVAALVKALRAPKGDQGSLSLTLELV